MRNELTVGSGIEIKLSNCAFFFRSGTLVNTFVNSHSSIMIVNQVRKKKTSYPKRGHYNQSEIYFTSAQRLFDLVCTMYILEFSMRLCTI